MTLFAGAFALFDAGAAPRPPIGARWQRPDRGPCAGHVPSEGREAPSMESNWRETREGTLNPTTVSTKRQWIAELARSKRGMALHSLHHVIDLEWMKEAWRLTRKDGAAGIDGVVA